MARGINKRILILCEGVTEYLYSKSLQASLSRERQRMVTIEVIQHKQNDPRSLVKEAKKKVIKAQREKNAYDCVWLFFDHDNSPHLAEAFEICSQEGFNLAYSAISLEFWFILHFEDSGRLFRDGEECLRYLMRLWPKYHKTKLNHFAQLTGSMDDAIVRAERLEKKYAGRITSESNPYTSVHQMIAFFRSLEG